MKVRIPLASAVGLISKIGALKASALPIAVAALALISGPVMAPSASANPYQDPLHPNYTNGWCPGAGLVFAGRGNGWCDGVDYPDGSFWHQAGLNNLGVWSVVTRCKLHTGMWLLDAPPGGCGGEW